MQQLTHTENQRDNDEPQYINEATSLTDISKLICFKQLCSKNNINSFKLDNGIIVNQQKNETKKIKTIYEEITSKNLSEDKIMSVIQTLIKNQENENNKAYTCQKYLEQFLAISNTL